MKVVEHLARARGPLVSFEIIPPLRGGSLEALTAVVEALLRYRPPFIDITSHAAEVVYEETPEGIRKRTKRKRPGTLGLCALVQNKYGVDAVPHVLCRGFDREETEDFLIELRYLGIDNVMALRGDAPAAPPRAGRTAHRHASELVAQIAAMNEGRYLTPLLDADPSDFCVGVAGYPEKHWESPNLDVDLRHLGEKVAAGAEYIVTQMFFDNAPYFDFVARCRAAGIEVPIIPGLKVLTAPRQLERIPRAFHVTLPVALTDALEGASPADAAEIGVEWAVRQTTELFERGAPAAHFYVMQSADAVSRVIDRLGL